MMEGSTTELAMHRGYKDSWHQQLRTSCHQLKLRLRQMPPYGRGLLLVSTLFCCFVVYRILVYTFITDISYHTESSNCPACYGTRMCRRIHETRVHGVEAFHYINSIVNVKNVYFGRLNGLELVFKKLAHTDELERVDTYLCRGGFSQCMRGSSNNNQLCVIPPSDSFQLSCDMTQAVANISSRLAGPVSVSDVIGLSDAMQCPSPRLVRRMVHRYRERGEFVDEHGLSVSEKFSLLYTLAVNPEPIILQMFPHGEKWPFPAYIGACGRIIAEDYAGVPLRDYFYADWRIRIKLALRLLHIADQLTDNSAGYKLYFSDISLDNYSVQKDSLEVTINDAENILIVDEQLLAEDKNPGYDEPHHSVYDYCEHGNNCLTIDVVSLCSKTQSDFNYYALCKSLLSSSGDHDQGMTGGLLHSLPASLKQSQTIKSLADECAKPPPNKDRFVIKDELILVLESVIKSLTPATESF